MATHRPHHNTQVQAELRQAQLVATGQLEALQVIQCLSGAACWLRGWLSLGYINHSMSKEVGPIGSAVTPWLCPNPSFRRSESFTALGILYHGAH
jgi:hypothetical protein